MDSKNNKIHTERKKKREPSSIIRPKWSKFCTGGIRSVVKPGRGPYGAVPEGLLPANPLSQDILLC